jgi:hypothetical protein
MEFSRHGKNYRYKKPLPIGVFYSQKIKAYVVRVWLNNKVTSIARFKKEQDAIQYFKNHVTSN